MSNKSRLILLVLSLTLSIMCKAQTIYTETDSLLFEKYKTELSGKKALPTNELIVATGKFFLGQPYVGGTLEREDGKELLTINLRELDCTTFVENCIALSLELQKDSSSFSGYIATLEALRYRGGNADGYNSRLHYTSDWAFENAEILDNITTQLGGQISKKPLNFISKNQQLYPSLEKVDSEQPKNEKTPKTIEEIEANINNRNNYALIPVSQIRNAAEQIKPGDIIIFGTKMSGLDYSHIGIALWDNGELRLLHASSARKKVVIDPKSLVEYCTTSKTCTGITVLRIKNK